MLLVWNQAQKVSLHYLFVIIIMVSVIIGEISCLRFLPVGFLLSVAILTEI
jgi:hypothetical protein